MLPKQLFHQLAFVHQTVRLQFHCHITTLVAASISYELQYTTQPAPPHHHEFLHLAVAQAAHHQTNNHSIVGAVGRTLVVQTYILLNGELPTYAQAIFEVPILTHIVVK